MTKEIFFQPFKAIDACRNAAPAQVDKGSKSTFAFFQALFDFEKSGADRQWLERLRTDPQGPYKHRDLDCFIGRKAKGSEHALGPYLKWLVALKTLARAVIDDSATRDWAALIAEPALRKRLQELVAPQRETEFLKVFHRSASSRASDFDEQPARSILQAIIEQLNRRLRRRPRQLTVEAIAGIDLKGNWDEPDNNPLMRFEHWLIHGIRPPSDDLMHLMPEMFVYAKSDDTDARRIQLIDTLHALADTSSAKPILNVHASSRSIGLRAFATEIIWRLHSARMAGAAQPFTHLVYVRLEGAGKTTRASVTKQLLDLFGLGAAVERGSDDGHISFLDPAFSLLRRAFTIYPCTVVFDSVDNVAGPMAPIFELIKGTDWGEYIRVLCQPDPVGLELTDGFYRSRFLVLSEEPLASCSAWCHSVALASPPVGAVEQLYAMDAEKELEGITTSLGLHRSTIGLRSIFPLSDDGFHQMHALFAESGFPSETDIALASLAIAKLKSLDALVAESERQTRVWKRKWVFEAIFVDVIAKNPLDYVALQFIAMSAAGLRAGPLSAHLRRWVKLATAKDAKQSDALQRQLENYASIALSLGDQKHPLVAEYGQILSAGPGDSHPDIRLSSMEVERGMHLHIRHEEIRELFFATAWNSPALDTALDNGALPRARPCFELVNLILAEAALASATDAEAHPRAFGDEHGLSSLRPFVATLMHGLLSYPFGEKSPLQRSLVIPPPETSAFTADPLKRFRYLYLFLFKHCIEHGAERSLDRALGRTHVRIALLCLFASPSYCLGVLGKLHTADPDDKAGPRAFLDDEASLVEWMRRQESDWIREDVSLHRTIAENLAHAANDVEQHAFVANFAKKTTSLFSDLRKWRYTEGEVDETFFGLERSEIHSLQARRLASSVAECLKRLRTRNIDNGQLKNLSGLFRSDEVLAHTTIDFKGAFDEALRQRMADVIPATMSLETRMSVSDLLSRLGESMATQADEAPEGKLQLSMFVDAYAYYFISDQIRSDIGAATANSEWKIVSARPMRYYVRVAFKIARILSRAAGKGRRCDTAMSFFRHGSSRIDVYTRHLSRLPRERHSSLLLSAFAARVWADMGVFERKGEAPLPHLLRSLDLIKEAEAILFTLGMSSSLLKRFFFERLKTLRRLADCDAPNAHAWRMRADRDLAQLELLAKGNRFWETLVAKQKKYIPADKPPSRRTVHALVGVTQKKPPVRRGASSHSG